MVSKPLQPSKRFRGGQKTEANIKTLKDNMKYFGYGYIKNADETVPHIGINFWAFRIMVGLGALFILVFAIILFIVYRKDITRPRLLQLAGVALIPLAYIASECGWLVAEFVVSHGQFRICCLHGQLLATSTAEA